MSVLLERGRRIAGVTAILAACQDASESAAPPCRGTCGPFASCVPDDDSRAKRVGCALPDAVEATGGARALTRQFSALTMAIEPIEGRTPAAYRWTPPSGANVVQCAVFSCLPAVEPRDGLPSIEPNDRRDPPCVLHTRSFEPPVGVFDLAPLSSVLALNSGGGATLEFSYYGPFVACWAYDATRLIAATPLLSVLVDDLPEASRRAVRQPCDSRSVRGLCETDAGHLGACVSLAGSPRCVHRCLRDADCPTLEQSPRLGVTRPVDGGAANEPDASARCDFDVLPIHLDARPSVARDGMRVGFCVPSSAARPP